MAEAVDNSLETASGVAATRWLFIATIFTSALLLFLIQPMFARMALPKLGGAPAVWNTAMVFYQALLLGGYVYAHWLSKQRMPVQRTLHLSLLAAACLFLPIGLAGWYPPPDPQSPFVWLLGLLAVSIGLPFFAVSAQAPLMQRWFARTSDPHAHDPYFLYAASNLGSLVALLGFPFLIEPWLDLKEQGWLWAIGYIGLIALIWFASRPALAGASSSEATPNVEAEPPMSWRQRLHLIALAAVPSGLMLSVTNYITADIMAMPLLWIVPLCLYLLTFVIVFARRPLISHDLVVTVAPFGLVGCAGVAFTDPTDAPLLYMGIALSLFFIVCLVCHGELVRRRPGVSRLTEFYILMSVGGVLGGGFVALLAPILFNWIYEYVILLLAAVLLLPRASAEGTARTLIEAWMPARLLDFSIPLFWAAPSFTPAAARNCLMRSGWGRGRAACCSYWCSFPSAGQSGCLACSSPQLWRLADGSTFKARRTKSRSSAAFLASTRSFKIRRTRSTVWCTARLCMALRADGPNWRQNQAPTTRGPAVLAR
jgi:hypothetical protein